MWRLHRYEIWDSVSNVWASDPTRKGLTGFVVYDGLGHMGVQQVKAKGDSSDNNVDIVYFAKYILVNDSVIEHTKMSSNFDDAGSSVRRRFDVTGDTLVLAPEEAIERLRVVWIRVNNK